MEAQVEARGQLGWWAGRSIRTEGQTEIAVPLVVLRTVLAPTLERAVVNDRPDRPPTHSPVK